MNHSANHQLASGSTEVARNPFAVLNAVPQLEADLQLQLREKAKSVYELLREDALTPEIVVSGLPGLSVTEEGPYDDMPQIRKTLHALSVDRMDHATSAADASRQRAYLQRLLECQRAYFAVRALAEGQPGDVSALEESRAFLILVPDFKPDLAADQPLMPEHVQQLRCAIDDAIENLAATLTRPRSSKRYRQLMEASMALELLMDKATPEKARRDYMKELTDLSAAIEIYQALAYRDAPIYKAYKTVASEFHPDVRPGDAHAEQRFKEASIAFKQLKGAPEEERASMAMNLVFGGRSELWTSEMREVADPIRRQFQAVFALEQPLNEEAIPCDACKGAGANMVQGPQDYFPVPVVCDACAGNGCIATFTDTLQRLQDLFEAEDEEDEQE